VYAEKEQRGSRGGAQVDGNLPLAGEDLLDDLEFTGDWFSSAKGRSAPRGGREVERGQMAGRGGFQREFRFITDGGALGLACTSSETIGRRGRLCGAARCAESREQARCVGG
jgi:hypothetical protein